MGAEAGRSARAVGVVGGVDAADEAASAGAEASVGVGVGVGVGVVAVAVAERERRCRRGSSAGCTAADEVFKTVPL